MIGECKDDATCHPPQTDHEPRELAAASTRGAPGTALSSSPAPHDGPRDPTSTAQPPIPQSSERRYLLATLAVYAVALLVVTWHHEPWRDESSSWLMARDNTLQSLWDRMGYAGTPALWYLVLMPFAKLGLPFFTQLLVNNVLAIAAGAVLLFFCPLPAKGRVLALFSYGLGYELSVVSRSYALTTLLLFAALAVRGARKSRPVAYGVLLALLANTNLHGLVIVLSLGAVEAWQWYRSRLDFRRTALVAGLGALLAIVQLIPPADGQLQGGPSAPRWWIGKRVLAEMVIASSLPSQNLSPTAPLILNLAAGGAALFLLRRRPRGAAFLLISCGALMTLYLCVYYGGARHAQLLTILGVAAFWYGSSGQRGRAATLDRFAAIVIYGVLAGSCLATLQASILDYQLPFSGSTEAANFLNSPRLRGRIVATFPDWLGATVLPLLEQDRVWYAGRQAWGSCLLYDLPESLATSLPYDEALRRIGAHFGRDARLLLVFNAEMVAPQMHGLREVFRNTRPSFAHSEESYFVYEPVEAPPSQVATP